MQVSGGAKRRAGRYDERPEEHLLVPCGQVHGGTVEVYDCITDRACGSPWKAEGFEFYCWLLRNPRALREPIPYTGRLGLFDIPWSEEGLFSTDTGVEEVLRRA